MLDWKGIGKMVEKIKAEIEKYEELENEAQDNFEFNKCGAILDMLNKLLKYALEKQKTCCVGRKE